MDIDTMFPSKYLRAADLRGPVTVTLASVKPEKMHKPGAGEVTGYVLYCERASRGIVLSKALALSIAQALSEKDTDRWPGRQVVLYPQTMTVAARELVAIRARAATPQPEDGKG